MRDGVELKVRACSVVIQCRGLGLGSKPRGSDGGLVRALHPSCGEQLSEKPSGPQVAHLYNTIPSIIVPLQEYLDYHTERTRADAAGFQWAESARSRGNRLVE